MTKQLWGGRFESGPSDLLRRLSDSFSFDRELFAEDIEGSIAWATALGHAGALTRDEAGKIIDGLKRIAPPDGEQTFEDVHSYVEGKLFGEIGALAGKLHTGRSRNDQVATDLKLWLKKASTEADRNVTALCLNLAQRAIEEAGTPMPGYTHSKQAEPITFGHWCLAYVEMLLRDRARLRDNVARNNGCPLGSGALAGSPVPVDREALAKALGFARPTANSLDAVADRDFAIDYLYAATMVVSHLSRLAEDLIFYTSDEVAFAELPDSMATGSSRMPQKKNPDVLELVRGHAGRSIGELTGLLSIMKGLPLAYDKDLQLDKEPLFRTRTVLAALLPAIDATMEQLKLDRARMRDAASAAPLLATAVADAIAATGMPFREAHDMVSRNLASLDALARQHGVTLDTILARKSAIGGTSPERVQQQARAALERLGAPSLDQSAGGRRTTART